MWRSAGGLWHPPKHVSPRDKLFMKLIDLYLFIFAKTDQSIDRGGVCLCPQRGRARLTKSPVTIQVLPCQLIRQPAHFCFQFNFIIARHLTSSALGSLTGALEMGGGGHQAPGGELGEGLTQHWGRDIPERSAGQTWGPAPPWGHPAEWRGDGRGHR